MHDREAYGVLAAGRGRRKSLETTPGIREHGGEGVLIPGDVLISETEIAHAVQKIATEVAEDYDLSDLLLVGVMDGAACFLADLLRALPGSIDATTVRASSYDGTEAAALNVAWLPPRKRIEGRPLLIVEDVVDTGATASALIKALTKLGAASVNVCTLLNKPSRRVEDVTVTYTGFEIPDTFVVGYGLDYTGAYRHLRDIHELIDQP